MSIFAHKIPKWVLDMIPDDFWKILYGELNKIFDDVPFDALPWFAGTIGWQEAVATTCKKLNMNDILEYYDNLELFDSILFEGELCRILCEKLGMKV